VVVDDPSYAVVLVTHNHASTIGSCLTAVASLEPPPQAVVVLDNASHDRSREGVVEFAERLPLQVLLRDQNIGFAAAVNACITTTDTPWVLVLNPDCAPRPDFVVSLQRAISRRPSHDRIASATGKLYRPAESGSEQGRVLDAAGMVVTTEGRHFDRGAGEVENGRYDRPAWVFGGTGAATLFRRRALDDVAYPEGEILAESFFAYREDAELAWRLQWRGWSCLYVPDAVATHARGFRPEVGREGHATINRLSVRNRFLLRLHCADLRWHLTCLPWWLVRDLMVVIACFTVERSSLPALAEVWRLRHNAARCRRWIMERRVVSSRQLRRWFRKKGWVEEISDS